MYAHHAKQILPLALAAMALIGCGSDTEAPTSGIAPTQGPEHRAGDQFKAAVLLDEKPYIETDYKLYAVTDNLGTLSSTPLGDPAKESQLPHVLLKQSTQQLLSVDSNGKTTPINKLPKLQSPVELHKIENCYKDFWQTVRTLAPGATPQMIAARIRTFGSIDDLCTQAAASGLSVHDYADLYRTVAKYYPEASAHESHIVAFFQGINVTPKDFLTALNKAGYTWDDFVKRLSTTKGGAYEFIGIYNNSTVPLDRLITKYMTGQIPVTAFIDTNLKLAQAYLSKGATPNFLARLSPARLLAENKNLQTSTDASEPAWMKRLANMTAAEAEAWWALVNKVLTTAKQVWEFAEEQQAEFKDGANSVQTHIISEADSNLYNYANVKRATTPKITFKGGWLGELFSYRVDMVVNAHYDGMNSDFPGHWVPSLYVTTQKAIVNWGWQATSTVVMRKAVNMGKREDPIPEVMLSLSVEGKFFDLVKQTVDVRVNGTTGLHVEK